MVTQSDLDRERYEARLKFRRDEYARLHDARLEGEERGLAQGMERGIAQGVLIGRVQLAERLLRQEPTPPETLRTLPLEQLHALVGRLEGQLAGIAPTTANAQGDGGFTHGDAE